MPLRAHNARITCRPAGPGLSARGTSDENPGPRSGLVHAVVMRRHAIMDLRHSFDGADTSFTFREGTSHYLRPNYPLHNVARRNSLHASLVMSIDTDFTSNTRFSIPK